MNSFRTREESLEILGRYPDLAVDGLPLDFLQNKEPKLRADDLGPVEWPEDPDLEWCPPGHGDVYVALQTTGAARRPARAGLPLRLPVQRRQPRRHLRGSGARPGWRARASPTSPRSAPRTRNDRKGGHLAVRRSDGRLVLRDSAMVAEGEDHYFQDTDRHRVVPRQQPLGRPRRAGRAPGRARRHPRPADHRQPQDRRPDPAGQHARSSRSSRRWARRSRSSTARARSRSTAAGSVR